MKTLLSQLFVTITICSLMTACNDNSTNSNAIPSNTTNSATTQAEASDAGNNSVTATTQDSFVSKLPENAPVVNVVTVGKTLPFSFSGTDGNPIGMDIDIIQQIGESQGFKVKIRTDAWANLFTAVESKKADLAISGISYTKERAEKYALSDSYALNPGSLMYTKPELTGKVTDIASLGGLRLGALENSKHAKQMNEVGLTDVRTYQSTFLLFKGLLQNEVDVIAQDGILLEHLIKQNPEHPAHIRAYENANEPSAQLVILMHKDNKELKEKINNGLTELKQNGELDKIKEKWLGKNKQ